MTKKFFKDGLNRFNYKEIARQIGSSKGYERPEENVIENPNQPSQQIIVQQNLDKNEINYLPKKGDKHFDIVGSTPVNITILPIGEIILYTYIVPIGTIFNIQQYCFFVLIDETPAIPYPVLAEPTELLGIANFGIKSNGIHIAEMQYWPGAPFGVLDGLPIISKDPNRDSNPNANGIIIPVRGGSRIDFVLRKIAAVATWRPTIAAGFRIRGYTTTESVRR